MLHVDPSQVGSSAHQLAERLAGGNPKIVLRSLHSDRGYLLFDVRRIDEDELELIAASIRKILAEVPAEGPVAAPPKGDLARMALAQWPARSARARSEAT
jgi:hypothetical protein